SAIPYPGGADADIMPSVPGGEQTGDRDLTVFIRLNRRRCSARSRCSAGHAAPPGAGDLGRSYPRQGAEASKISESLVRPTGRPGVREGGDGGGGRARVGTAADREAEEVRGERGGRAGDPVRHVPGEVQAELGVHRFHVQLVPYR